MGKLSGRPKRFNVGARLKELRDKAGLSQPGLASLSGEAQATISRAERGCGITVDRLDVLANALGKTLLEFFDVQSKHRRKVTVLVHDDTVDVAIIDISKQQSGEHK